MFVEIIIYFFFNIFFFGLNIPKSFCSKSAFNFFSQVYLPPGLRLRSLLRPIRAKVQFLWLLEDCPVLNTVSRCFLGVALWWPYFFFNLMGKKAEWGFLFLYVCVCNRQLKVYNIDIINTRISWTGICEATISNNCNREFWDIGITYPVSEADCYILFCFVLFGISPPPPRKRIFSMHNWIRLSKIVPIMFTSTNILKQNGFPKEIPLFSNSFLGGWK